MRCHGRIYDMYGIPGLEITMMRITEQKKEPICFALARTTGASCVLWYFWSLYKAFCTMSTRRNVLWLKNEQKKRKNKEEQATCTWLDLCLCVTSVWAPLTDWRKKNCNMLFSGKHGQRGWCGRNRKRLTQTRRAGDRLVSQWNSIKSRPLTGAPCESTSKWGPPSQCSTGSIISVERFWNDDRIQISTTGGHWFVKLELN